MVQKHGAIAAIDEDVGVGEGSVEWRRLHDLVIEGMSDSAVGRTPDTRTSATSATRCLTLAWPAARWQLAAEQSAQQLSDAALSTRRTKGKARVVDGEARDRGALVACASLEARLDRSSCRAISVA